MIQNYIILLLIILFFITVFYLRNNSSIQKEGFFYNTPDDISIVGVTIRDLQTDTKYDTFIYNKFQTNIHFTINYELKRDKDKFYYQTYLDNKINDILDSGSKIFYNKFNQNTTSNPVETNEQIDTQTWKIVKKKVKEIVEKFKKGLIFENSKIYYLTNEVGYYEDDKYYMAIKNNTFKINNANFTTYGDKVLKDIKVEFKHSGNIFDHLKEMRKKLSKRVKNDIKNVNITNLEYNKESDFKYDISFNLGQNFVNNYIYIKDIESNKKIVFNFVNENYENIFTSDEINLKSFIENKYLVKFKSIKNFNIKSGKLSWVIEGKQPVTIDTKYLFGDIAEKELNKNIVNIVNNKFNNLDSIKKSKIKTKITSDNYFNIIPTLKEEDRIKYAKDKCEEYDKQKFSDERIKEDNIFINPKNPGCIEYENTKWNKRKTKCNPGEKMVYEGDIKSDIKCGVCTCPENYIGKPTSCSGTQDDLKKNNYIGIKGCKKQVICEKNSSDSKECKEEKCMYFSKPDEYGDKKNLNICKKCKKMCPVGTYKIQDCIDGTNTDLICKSHRVCDYETMITVKNGTNNEDTICKCIKGYEWPIDKITLEKNRDANKCVKIKGECYKNPCNKNAFCYDNFDEYTGLFKDYVCKCDTKKGYIENPNANKPGAGEDGCILLPKRHSHLLDEKNIDKRFRSLSENPEYKNIDTKQFTIKTHLDRNYHGDVYNTHIHKNINLAPY